MNTTTPTPTEEKASARQKSVTISSLCRPIGGRHRRYESVPSIRLSGKWLAALGLTSGQMLRVLAVGSTLTLTLTPR